MSNKHPKQKARDEARAKQLAALKAAVPPGPTERMRATIQLNEYKKPRHERKRIYRLIGEHNYIYHEVGEDTCFSVDMILEMSETERATIKQHELNDIVLEETATYTEEEILKKFIRFLKKINRAVAKHLDVHAICDNYKTHKTKEVQAWLAKHPRFKLHFTPTSSSWINLVERLFAEITRQQIRRGVFKSVAELEAAIETWLTERNVKPKPFKWTAKANIILEEECTCQARAGRRPRGGY